LSKLGFASRAEAAALVRAGRVRVDGRPVTDPERRTDPRRERISVDGHRVAARATIVLAMHKPTGVVTTRKDERGRATVYDLLPTRAGWVFPVGRLDAATSGLLLFTNDTRLGDALSGDRSVVEKTYEVEVDGALEAAHAARLAAGVEIALPGEGIVRTRPARCALLAAGPPGRLSLVIVEGKNRQVRRMCDAIGRPVLALRRTRVGPISLGALAPGATRALTPAEVEALRRAAGL
jgi:23S rRNA pseudouridine2605 synthase